MKAIGLMKFCEPGVLEEINLECPVCGENEVLIQVEGASVNYADLQTRRGSYHAGGTVFPIIPGLDAAGIITSIGSCVKSLKVGQRVIAFPHSGTYTEYVKADSNLVFPVPDSISWEQAIACPLVAFTSSMLLEKVAHFERNETLLLHAASGGIGTTAIQIARNMGAAKIIGTVGSPHKRQAALDAGADEVLCLTEGDFSERVRDLTEGKGVDDILDSLGGSYTPRGMECLAPYGRMVVFGSASGQYSQLTTGLFHASCRSLLGFSIGSTRKMRPAWFTDTALSVMERLTSGQIHVPISAQFSLEDAAKAHALIEARNVTGKVILRRQ